MNKLKLLVSLGIILSVLPACNYSKLEELLESKYDKEFTLDNATYNNGISTGVAVEDATGMSFSFSIDSDGVWDNYSQHLFEDDCDKIAEEYLKSYADIDVSYFYKHLPQNEDLSKGTARDYLGAGGAYIVLEVNTDNIDKSFAERIFKLSEDSLRKSGYYVITINTDSKVYEFGNIPNVTNIATLEELNNLLGL